MAAFVAMFLARKFSLIKQGFGRRTKSNLRNRSKQNLYEFIENVQRPI